MQFTKYTGTITGEVGSLITALDAILVTGEGWTKVYTGTDKAVYQAPSGSQLYLRVQDDAPGAGGAKEARITGYETMSDVDTGTGPFPTAAQGVGGAAFLVVRKSVSADNVTRSYKAWADARSLLFFCKSEVAVASAGSWYAFSFGEFYSFVTADAYNCAICGRAAENSNAVTAENLCSVQVNMTSAGIGFYVARGHLGLGGSVLMGRTSDSAKGGSSETSFNGVVYFPNPADGGLYVSRIWLHDTVTLPAIGVRGRFRGLWVPLHISGSYADGDVFAGTGELAGKTFEMVKVVYATSGIAGVAAIETSDTLETN